MKFVELQINNTRETESYISSICRPIGEIVCSMHIEYVIIQEYAIGYTIQVRVTQFAHAYDTKENNMWKGGDRWYKVK